MREESTSTIDFTPGPLGVVVGNGDNIVLLGTSNVSLTVYVQGLLAQVANLTKVKLTATIPQ